MTYLPRLVTVAAAASALGVHAETLRRAIRRGDLDCYKFGACIRLAPEQIQRFIECQDQNENNPTSSSVAGSGASRGTMQGNVGGFRLEQRMKKALDSPLRISKHS